MENNTDKEMRDKLQSAEFPFDPKAWEQMESMLDEKREPKGFFWWWFGGVAASLFMAAGIYGYFQFTGTNTNDKQVVANTMVNTPAHSAPYEPANTTSAGAVPAGQISDTQLQSTNAGAPSTPSANEPVKPGDEKAMANTSTKAKDAAPKKSRLANSSRTTTSAPAKVASGKTVSKTKAHHSKGNGNFINDEKNDSPVLQAAALSAFGASGKNTSASNVTANTTAPKQTDAALAGMNTMEADELKASQDDPADILKKQDGTEVTLKKAKKKIFNYSLGVEANITGATLGAQTGAGISQAFDHTPSYMVGFTHDFMFFKRFAITNSVLFSQTSFTVTHPNSSYVSSYSCAITEMAIPIGIKAYAVSKSKFRFYLAAGIINHIKLKETFIYHYVNNNNMIGIGSGNLPSQTQFTQDPAPYANSLGYASYYSTADYSINQAKRYYVSFYASAGTEFIVQRHFVFFTEPLFYMALQKVGIQEKYKYNLGLTGGFRYQF